MENCGSFKGFGFIYIYRLLKISYQIGLEKQESDRGAFKGDFVYSVCLSTVYFGES